MTGAMDGTFAAFSGFWAALNRLSTSRGLPEVDHDEARRLWHLALDEEARVTFQHLRRAFCTGTCPQETQS